jgi:hypothetical protein
MKISPKQYDMLRAFAIDGEATDIAGFDGPLGWHNRERVIDALRRKGLLDDNGVTLAGRRLLKLPEAVPVTGSANG